MSLNFPRNHRIAGTPVTALKAGLKSLARTKDPGSFVGLRSAFETTAHGAHALRVAELLGLINEAGDDITPTGRAVVQSKSMKKTDLAKADAALAELLKHIHELNQNPDRLFTITHVYLYGSVMRRAAQVGDIDLEIRTERGPKYARGTDFRVYLDACLACVRNFNPNYYDDGMTGEIDKAAEYLIFGKRRSPLLKGAQINSHQLQLIGAPCQLIYSDSKGIDLASPILNAHPDYDPEEKTTHDTPQLTTLDTTIAAMPQPIDARFLSKYRPEGHVNEGDFGPYASNPVAGMIRRVEYFRNRFRLFTGSESGHIPFKSSKTELKQLDPRHRIILEASSFGGGLRTTMIVKRQIDMVGNDAVVKLEIERVRSTRRKTPDTTQARCLLVLASALHSADLFHTRQLLTASEGFRKIIPRISFDQDFSEESPQAVSVFSEMILSAIGD